MQLNNNIADGLEVVKTSDSSGLTMPISLPLTTITLVGTFTPTYIAPNTRSVQQFNLGALGNPNSLLIALYDTVVADADVPKFFPITLSTTSTGGKSWGANANIGVGGLLPSTISNNSFLLVSNDYTKTRRFTTNIVSSNTEQYGSSPTNLPTGYTYADIGVGVLYGYYSIGGAVAAWSALNTSGKVQVESVWLSQSGANTYVNIAWYNISSGRSVSDGVTTLNSTTITSATMAFTSADVGRTIIGAGIPANTTIVSVTNSTTAVLSAPATSGGTGVTLTIVFLPYPVKMAIVR